jgi:hypothetical protein
MKGLIAGLMCLGLAACGSTGVIPMDRDSYMIGKRSAQMGVGMPVGTKADVYTEANAFCSAQDKMVNTIQLDMTPSMPASPGSVTLQFTCISRGSATAQPMQHEVTSSPTVIVPIVIR